LNSLNTFSKDTSKEEKNPISWEARSPKHEHTNIVDEESLSVELEATDPNLSDELPKESEFPADQICVTRIDTSPRDLSECDNASKQLQLMQQEFHTQAEIILSSSNKKTTKSHVERELEYHHEDMECHPDCDENHDISTSTNQQSKLSSSRRETGENGELTKPQLTSCLNTFPPQTVSSPKEICEKTTSVGKLRQLWEGKKSSPSSDSSAPHIRYEMNSPANRKQQKTAEISRLLKANVDRKLAPELKMVSAQVLNQC
jgi:hypothetical protein